MVEFETKLLAAKVFLMVLLPLAVGLPVWVVLEPEAAGQGALAFFMVLPYAVYPLAWCAGAIFDLWNSDPWFPPNEVILVGAFGAFVLPVCVLLPIYLHVPMTTVAKDIVLTYVVALLGIWVPLLSGMFFTTKVQEAIAMHRLLGAGVSHPKAPSPNDNVADLDTASASGELSWDVASLFFFLSIPLGFFVPLYVGVEHTVAGETAMVFFMLLSNLVAFHWRIAPRARVLLFTSLKPDATRPGATRGTLDKAEAIVKLLYGCAVLPMMILLPLYLHAAMEPDPRKMLLAFMLALPAVYILEVIRVAHRHSRAQLPIKIAGAYFGLTMPLGILLPVWLAAHPDGEGKSILLSFMLSPTALCLLVSAVFTLSADGARLPFYPLDAFWSARGETADLVYTLLLTVTPAVVLAPVYFQADFEDMPALVVLCFIAIFCGLLALLFAISWCRRDAHGVASDAVIDLPYASTTGIRVASTGATRGDDIMGKGDAKFISANFRSQFWADKLGGSTGGAAPDDMDESSKGSAAYVNMDDNSTVNSEYSTVGDDDDDDDDDGGWAGWKVGMPCKAPYPADDMLYEAIIKRLDERGGTAVVVYNGYEGSPGETCAIADLHQSDEMHGGDLEA